MKTTEVQELMVRSFGVQDIQVSDLAVKRTLIEERVPGGYMNRWLVRRVREVVEPCCFHVKDTTGIFGVGQRNVLVVHPTIMETLRKRVEQEMARIRENVTGFGSILGRGSVAKWPGL